MPLPPYIDRPSDVEDASRYQTVFGETPGALAAPTAGLHFTPAILGALPHAFVTFHVGLEPFVQFARRISPSTKCTRNASYSEATRARSTGNTNPGGRDNGSARR